MFNITDDFISPGNQERLKNVLTSPFFPWWYHSGTVTPDERKEFGNNSLQSKEVDWFCHKFITDGEPTNSSEFYLIEENLNPILYLFSEEWGWKLDRCQANLVPPSGNWYDRRHTSWHVDSPDDHMVLIYYVNDSPARTLFRGGGSCKPKQGRFITFDGKNYHSAEIPKKKSRCVINFNFKKI